jgi:hypothetical protein
MRGRLILFPICHFTRLAALAATAMAAAVGIGAIVRQNTPRKLPRDQEPDLL